MSSETLDRLNPAIALNKQAITPALGLAIVAWWALVALMVFWPDKPVGFAPPRFVGETHRLFGTLAAALTVASLLGRVLQWGSWIRAKKNGRGFYALGRFG